MSLVRIGFLTDTHYGPDIGPTGAGTRICPDGLKKITDAVKTFNREVVDCVVFNGDLIDHHASSASVALTDLAALTAVMNTLSMAWYPNFGNHDFDVLTHDQCESTTGKDIDYRSFDINGLHVVILDGCYLSDSDGALYAPPAPDYTLTYVNPGQRTWLIADLAATLLPTIIFVHQKPFGSDVSVPPIRNASALRTILESAPRKIVGVLNGHVHENVSSTANGITYYSMQAATELAYPRNAYAIIYLNTVTGAMAIEGRGSGQTHYGTRA